MAPVGGKSVSNTGKVDGGRRKDKSSVALDGLIADLFRRVHKPLDLVEAPHFDHLAAIRPIHRILLQIQKHEKAINNSPAPLDGPSRMSSLSNWLSQNGVETKRLKFEDKLPEGAGVVATEKISEGEIFASVPSNLMMTTLTAIQSKEDVGLLAAHDPWLRAVPSLILAMHLLFEKHRPLDSPSKWRGYIESLPGQFNIQETNIEGSDQIMLPLAFSMETIEHLKGTSALGEFHKLLTSVAKQYCHMRIALRQLAPASPSIARSLSWFNFVQFRWAVSMVMMRQNRVPLSVEGGGMEHAMALVPLFDMFNHEEGNLTSHYDFGANQMEVSAKRDFSIGDQIYMSYGTRPNILYLLYAGFLPSQNSVDRIRVFVDLNPSDPLYTKKLALLKWLEVKPKSLLDLFWDGSPSPSLASWLTVAAMDCDVTLMKKMRETIASRAEATAAILEEKGAMAGGGERERRETERFVEAAKSLAGSVKEAQRKEGDEGYEGGKEMGGEGGEVGEKNGETILNVELSNGKESNDGYVKEGDGNNMIGVGLSSREGKLLVEICEEKLREMGVEGTEEENFKVGLGLGLGIENKIKSNVGEGVKGALKREKHLVSRLKEGERDTLKAAVSRWKIGQTEG